MKKILSLLLLIPLATIAAEHAGKGMQEKAPAEHAGEAMKKKAQSGKAAEHAGEAMEKKEQEGYF